MVDDRLTDGKRIAQLLSSELSGRESGPLGPVSVVDADPEAEPSEDGTEAYAIAVDGTRVGTVTLYPAHAAVRLTTGADSAVQSATAGGLPAERDNGEAVLRVEDGAAVKRAVDAVVAAVAPE
jgi:hypothetical protein